MQKTIYVLLFTALFISFKIALAQRADYFQQEVKYTIHVALDDTLHTLAGSETMEYTNHSPATLTFIYFELFPNAYKNEFTSFAKQEVENNSLDFYFSDEKDRGYISNLDFKVNGLPAKMELLKDSIDIGILYLPQPLAPNQTITIATPFFVKIPKTFSRMGHDGQQYQISQWFPKPSVYDSKGWHAIPYLDQGEFYSEYGSFDVSITVPKNYVVAATGELQNDDEKKWLQANADTTAKMDAFPTDMSFPKSSAETKTLHYTANKVHDFAWFADKRYHVLKSEVELPDSHRKVNTWIYFTNKKSKQWSKAIPYINNAVTYYSKWIGDYAYNNVSAVEGALKAGGGMEYPMITVIGGINGADELETVIVHEVGHNWFMGMLGSNERDYPWMDEGINSYYEQRYTNLIAAKKDSTKSKKGIDGLVLRTSKGFSLNALSSYSQQMLAYLFTARKNEDQAAGAPSVEFTSLNYYADVYCKTPLLFQYLADIMGQDSLDKYMHTYFRTWQFKHPQPEDIKRNFSASPKYLDWFFDDAVNTNKKIDMKLKYIDHDLQKIGNDEFYKITIKNKGEMRSAYSLSAMKKDSIVKTIPYGGFLGEMDVLFPKGDYDKIRIDAVKQMPEIYKCNNTSRINGIFRTTNPIKIQPIGGIENSNKNQLFVMPAIGWNNYDGVMLGLGFYNHLLPKKFNFEFFPLYGVQSKTIAGLANVSYDWYPKSIFQDVRASIGGKRFTYNNTSISRDDFIRIAPQLYFQFKNKHLRNATIHSITLASPVIMQHHNYFEKGGALDLQTYFTFKYKIDNTDALNPYSIVVYTATDGNNYNKLTVTGKYKWVLSKNKKGISARVFIGEGFGNNYYSLSSYTGAYDVLYDNFYFGRNESTGFISKQINEAEGGFKSISTNKNLSPIGFTKGWLLTSHLNYDLPIAFPLRLYAGVGYMGTKSSSFKQLQYEGGVTFHLGEFVQFNFPLFTSKDFQDYYNRPEIKGNRSPAENYLQKITFSVNLNMANPFELIRNFKL